MNFPWRVDLEVNGKQFGRSMLFRARHFAETEYYLATKALQKSQRENRINSYHLALRPIPWCGDETPKGNLQ